MKTRSLITAALALSVLSTTALALDTDGDGLDDAVETNTGVFVDASNTGTDPNNADTDGDGVPDGLEVTEVTDPTNLNDFNSFSIGLVAYYPFDGNANDESGNGMHGSLLNHNLTTDRFGRANSAIQSLNGDSFQIGQGSNAAQTLVYWVKLETLNNRVTDFWVKSNVDFALLPTSLGGSFMYFADNTFMLDTGNGVRFFDGSQSLLTDSKEWVQVAFAYTGNLSQSILYLNGVPLNGGGIEWGSRNTFSVPSALLNMPDWSGTANWVDQIRVYDRILTESEISALYSFETPQFQIIEGDFTWQKAKADAEARGGRLAVLDTEEKIDAANAYLEGVGEWPNLWIGLTDSDREGEWRWVNGDFLSEENWALGEPNNAPEAGGNEDFACIIANGEWNDLPDDGWIYQPLGYLLEITPQNHALPLVQLGALYESPSGEALVIDATPIAGFPKDFTYQWYMNDLPIPALYGGNSATQTMDGTVNSEATWRVVVTNSQGSVEQTFVYRVFTDTDGDGLSDYRESNLTGTNPNNADSDGDGLNDYAEINTHRTNPNSTDGDGDGFEDGFELANSSDATSAASKPSFGLNIELTDFYGIPTVDFHVTPPLGGVILLEESSDMKQWDAVEFFFGDGVPFTTIGPRSTQPNVFYRLNLIDQGQ